MQKKFQTIIFLLLIISLLPGINKAQTKTGYKLPHYEKFKLSNGLTIYLMEKHDVPVMSVAAIIPAGAVYDGNKAGLASLTATCLRCGTKSYTKNQIEQQFDFAGASLDINGTTEFASLNAKFAVKDQEKILPVVKELLVNPVFPEEEINKEKKRKLVNLDQAKESPGSVIDLYWNKFFYGDYVYGNVVSGTISSVSSLTADDLKAFYKSYYNPNGSAIAVAGDFKVKEMKTILTRLFADWKKSVTGSNNLSTQSFNASANSRVLLVNKDDARETTLLIGGPGIARNNPDYLAIAVINTFFGGRFTSWINDELRIKSGLTYGAFSHFDFKRNNGTFFISTHTANETTEPAIDKALEVLNRLHNQALDSQTLISAKNYMIGLFPPRYQTTDQLAGLLAGMFWYNYDESYINNFVANVNAVDLKKAKEIIEKYFPRDKLQFVLIGKSSDIKKMAQKLGPVTEVQIKDDIGKGF
jgi:zinc protease